jgi:hypothetical protein
VMVRRALGDEANVRGLGILLSEENGWLFRPSRLTEEVDEPLAARRKRKDGFRASRGPEGERRPHGACGRDSSDIYGTFDEIPGQASDPETLVRSYIRRIEPKCSGGGGKRVVFL